VRVLRHGGRHDHDTHADNTHDNDILGTDTPGHRGANDARRHA
jgi:hypothetical protein